MTPDHTPPRIYLGFYKQLPDGRTNVYEWALLSDRKVIVTKGDVKGITDVSCPVATYSKTELVDIVTHARYSRELEKLELDAFMSAPMVTKDAPFDAEIWEARS